MLEIFESIIVVTGHYGSGKTNLSINLAIDLRKCGKEVLLADLDIVNPYFRSADFYTLAKEYGIEVAASPYANSNIELPAFASGLSGYIETDKTIIVDVGGDEVGARALGGLSERLNEKKYSMIYVVNKFRYMTRKPQESVEMLDSIENSSRLSVTHIVNNSNLGYSTKTEDILNSIDYAKNVAQVTGKQYAFTAARKDLAVLLSGENTIYPVDVYVKTPWQ